LHLRRYYPRGCVIAETVNRATPSSDELIEVFDNNINKESIAISDDGKGYKKMAEICGCKIVNANIEDSTYTLNRVNRFHRYIKIYI
jgi:hypothetical protein